MSASITVPASFKADFDYFCRCARLTPFEIQAWRDDIRADFAAIGTYVTEMAATYRFCFDTWGRLPTAQLCEGYLASRHWWPDDPDMFKRQGIMLLARLCWQRSQLPKMTE